MVMGFAMRTVYRFPGNRSFMQGDDHLDPGPLVGLRPDLEGPADCFSSLADPHQPQVALPGQLQPIPRRIETGAIIPDFQPD